jgi:hypothetical protein
MNIHSQRGVSSWRYWRSEGYLQLLISTASMASVLECTGDRKDICSYEYPQPAWRHFLNILAIWKISAAIAWHQFLNVVEIWRISAAMNMHSQRSISSWFIRDLKDIRSCACPKSAWHQFLNLLEIWRISVAMHIQSQLGVSSWTHWPSEA